MDNLRAVLKNLFCYISPNEVLKGNVTYNNISETTFLRLGNSYIDRYTTDELRNMYFFLKNEFEWQNHRLKGEVPGKKEQLQLNVFDALTAFDYSVLMEENGEPVCQYQHLLRWREMIVVLEEDLFITSFFALKDLISGNKRRDFFWRPVIGHNNFALNSLVAKGVAENHFHLKGSAPTFHLSWLSLMNHVDNEKFARSLRSYDDNKLQKNLLYHVDYVQDNMVFMWRKAALLRLFLFTRIKGEYIDFEKTYITIKNLLDNCNEEKLRQHIEEMFKGQNIEETIKLEDFPELQCTSIWKKIKILYSEHMVKRLLSDNLLLEEYICLIQRNINRIREEYNKTQLDYTICEPWLRENRNRHVNEVISGERWFLYTIFFRIYGKDSEWLRYGNWFYLYILLKENIRAEIVQINKNIGFANFYIYQERKEEFIDHTEYEDIYIKMAVQDTIWNQHIVSLEARIAPKKDACVLQKAIQKYDKCICKGLIEEEKEELMDRYFYVVHFIKEPDRREEAKGECRHYKKRIEVEEQAKAIAVLRDRGVPESQRIRGIDAASTEIGCRPEVFAHAFRYLKNYDNYGELGRRVWYEDKVKNRNIMATYHVGEDFLDIVDGLRAIDETINFLDFRCGDRLGHALALGVDIDEWYELKSNRILISKQDYLDNLVWLYSKIRKYNLADCGDAEIYIEKRFTEYFNEIYKNNLTFTLFSGINKNAAEYFDKRKIQHGYYQSSFHIGINEYYDAWKLRGDDPELYKEGYFKLDHVILDNWHYWAINRDYPQNYKIRYNPEIAILYYMYHYNEHVYEIGSQMVEVKVKQCVIEAVKKIRNIMQKEVARIGIGIETNPSSNYLIGTFRRYDKHPVSEWYNAGLSYDIKQLNKCPQIQVSINTDDQGVFSTYIENEYAYLALALEKSRDSEGNPIYNRNSILQWLENIRRMGIDQSFI